MMEKKVLMMYSLTLHSAIINYLVPLSTFVYRRDTEKHSTFTYYNQISRLGDSYEVNDVKKVTNYRV